MWKLMSDNCITEDDRLKMSEFVLSANRLTQSEKVVEFEKKWSEWQGCKYSVYVNSGSSANLLLVSAISHFLGKSGWVCQGITWSTNVSPVIQLGCPLQLSDICLDDFSPDIDNLVEMFESGDFKFLFLSHLLGFNSLNEKIIDLCQSYGVTLLEDCCESHGATFQGKKVGNFGLGSTFSFYFGHHMTTIEGGMVCTDNEELYHLLLLMRSHGLLRSLPQSHQEDNVVDGVDPKFTFLVTGYNLRNDEIHAVLGLNQLLRLDSNIEIRNRNLRQLLNGLDPLKYKTDYKRQGVSSFSLPLYRVDGRIQQVKDTLDNADLEWRPVIAGNLHKHPIMNPVNQFVFDDNINLMHENAIYVGNHQDVSENNVRELCFILNRI